MLNSTTSLPIKYYGNIDEQVKEVLGMSEWTIREVSDRPHDDDIEGWGVYEPTYEIG